jgi:hypothetical protein
MSSAGPRRLTAPFIFTSPTRTTCSGRCCGTRYATWSRSQTSFTDTYGAHATVIRILSQAEIVGEQVYGDGLRLLFRLSEAIAQGMTVASGSAGYSSEKGTAGQSSGEQRKDQTQHAELTALACLMMLERINYLLSVDVRLPREEMVDRLSAIIYAAFHTP